MTYDSDQLDVIGVRTNSVVTAGAGSGKTTVLVERFVSLIRDRLAKVDEILTLTFTQKAAAEMYERIYHRLQHEQKTNPTAEIADAVERFEDARISTIDSYCAAVARADALRFGIPPDFSSDQDALARRLPSVLRSNLLASLHRPGPAAWVRAAGIESALHEGLVPLAIEEFGPTYKKGAAEAAKDALAHTQQSVTKLLADLDDRYRLVQGLPDASKSVQCAHAILRGCAFPGVSWQSGNRDEALATIDALSKCRKIASNAKDQETAQIFNEAKEAAQNASRAVRRAVATLRLRDELVDLGTFFDDVADIVTAWKRETGILSYRDVAQMALSALRENAQLRRAEAGTFRFIMIDEFQDNNALQRDLLYLLAGRTAASADDRDDRPAGGPRTEDRPAAGQRAEDRPAIGLRSAAVEGSPAGSPRAGDQGSAAAGNRGESDPNVSTSGGVAAAGRSAGAEGSAATGNGGESDPNVPTAGGVAAAGRSAGEGWAPTEGSDGAEATVTAEGVEPNNTEATTIADHKLFFVGDEKQSIYRFRGADVRVFKSLALELSAAGGRSMSLASNYRSRRELVGFFNRLFEPVFGAGTGESAARFSAMAPGAPPSAVPGPFVRILAAYAPEAGSGAEMLSAVEGEFFHLAQTLRRLIDSELLPIRDRTAAGGEAGERPARWRDVAILLRSGTNRRALERMLRAFGIPHRMNDTRSLFVEAPSGDICAALTCAIFPEDRAATAAFLRSPFVRLSDDIVYRMLARPGDPWGAVPWPLPDEDRRKLEGAWAIREYVRTHADRVPHEEIIHALWYRYGYRYVILDDPRHHNQLGFYDQLRSVAHAYRAEPIVALINLLKDHEGRFSRAPEVDDVEEPTAEPEALRIMTIHASKGLEFPVVVLADAGNVGNRAGDATAPWYHHDTFGIVPRLDAGPGMVRGHYLYEEARTANESDEDAELRRLLYVACTRAESQLIISGRLERNGNAPKRSFLGMIAATLPDGMASDASVTLGPVEMTDCPPVERRELYRIESSTPGSAAYRGAPARRIVDRPTTVVGHSVTERHEAADPGAAPILDEPLATLPISADDLLETSQITAAFGTWVHEVIHRSIVAGRFVGGGIVAPPADIAGLDQPHVHRLRDAVSALAGGAYAEIRRRFADAPRVESELDILIANDDGTFTRGIIDLLVTSSQSCLVIDFKTDRSVRPNLHVAQVHTYIEAATELCGVAASAELWYVRSDPPYVHPITPSDRPSPTDSGRRPIAKERAP